MPRSAPRPLPAGRARPGSSPAECAPAGSRSGSGRPGRPGRPSGRRRTSTLRGPGRDGPRGPCRRRRCGGVDPAGGSRHTGSGHGVGPQGGAAGDGEHAAGEQAGDGSAGGGAVGLQPGHPGGRCGRRRGGLGGVRCRCVRHGGGTPGAGDPTRRAGWATGAGRARTGRCAAPVCRPGGRGARRTGRPGGIPAERTRGRASRCGTRHTLAGAVGEDGTPRCGLRWRRLLFGTPREAPWPPTAPAR